MLKVKIKTWEEMVTEFGMKYDSIGCKYLFTKYMEKKLPKDRIIFLDNELKFGLCYYSIETIQNFFIMENIWSNIEGRIENA